MKIHKRRPRRPPFLFVQSVGIGVTSSIRPIFIPDRARARRADCAPGPGVLVFVPPVARNLIWSALIDNWKKIHIQQRSSHITFATINSMEPRTQNTYSFATFSYILSSKHCSIWGRFITICLYFHSTRHANNGFAPWIISFLLKIFALFILNLKFFEKIKTESSTAN